MKEKRIIINGEETRYLIREDGTLFSEKSNRLLKGTFARNEYLTYFVTHNNKQYAFMAHRLVAEYFIPNPNNYTTVHHKNMNKLDNRVENLEWVTAKENNKIENKLPSKDNEEAIFSYELSNSWTLINNTTYQICREGYIANKNNRVLKGSERCGYLRVDLNGKRHSIHRLVYETFVGPIPKGYEIDHIDGNKQNNSVENLCLVSRSQNMTNAQKNGHKGQIKVSQFSPDGQFIKTYPSLQDAADDLGVTQAAIKAAANYGTKSCNSYWLREDSITTQEEFVSKMPKNIESLNGLKKTKIASDGNVYSATSGHLIPKFSDEKGKYCFVSTNNGKYEKFYFNP